MVDLASLNAPLPKPWLNIQTQTLTAGTVTTDILVANTVDFKTIETNSLTLVSQASVPNPAVGSITLFVNSADSNVLTAQDSLGNSVPYLATDGTGVMTGPLDFKSDIIITSDTLGAAVEIGAGASAPVTSGSVSVGGGATCHGNQQVALSNGVVGAGSNFGICIGRNSVCNGSADVVIGQSASSLGTGSSVVLGSQALGEAKNSINIGRSSHCTAAGNQCMAIGFGAVASAANGIAIGSSAGASATDAIGIGFGAVNSDANSCLFGASGGGILNIRPNNLNTCDLGTVLAAFRSLYLRDAALASACRYSQYGDVTVTNTVVETSLSTGTSSGSLVVSDGASFGTIYRFKLGCTWSDAVGSLTFRFKTNGAPLIAITIGPVVAVTQAMTIVGDIVVDDTGNAKCLVDATVDGLQEGMARATSAYDPSIINTFDCTAQWAAANAGNVLVVNYFYVETLYAQ